jgi:hypothetical protein
MSEIVLEARDIKRDYHVGGGLFGKPKVVHAVKRIRLRQVHTGAYPHDDRSSDIRRTEDRR